MHMERIFFNDGPMKTKIKCWAFWNEKGRQKISKKNYFKPHQTQKCSWSPLDLFFIAFFFGKKESTKWLARHDRNTFCRYKGQQKELKNVFHIIGLLVRISVHIYIKIVVISFWFFFMLHKNKKNYIKIDVQKASINAFLCWYCWNWSSPRLDDDDDDDVCMRKYLSQFSSQVWLET